MNPHASHLPWSTFRRFRAEQTSYLLRLCRSCRTSFLLRVRAGQTMADMSVRSAAQCKPSQILEQFFTLKMDRIERSYACLLALRSAPHRQCTCSLRAPTIQQFPGSKRPLRSCLRTENPLLAQSRIHPQHKTMFLTASAKNPRGETRTSDLEGRGLA